MNQFQLYKEIINIMEQKNICATKVNYKDYVMCEHCSSAKFNNDGSMYWQCNKYNVKLNENQDKFLTKCKQCIDNI